MTSSSFLDTFGVFRPECGHVPLRLRSLPGACILWLNRSAMQDDPAFSRLRGDESAYRKHLLEACAYQVVSVTAPPPSNGEKETIGIADRYGGNGIGKNGGSGRNALVNDYFVKGIGRTPLVSHLTPLSHASGGAYLEEAVRETIFAEVVIREFPYGAVPTLAIIDTGLDQDWPEGIVPSRERRVLIVRPPFVRPAHFERAIGFISPNIKEGAQDHARVTAVFVAARRGLGEKELVARLFTFFERWAHQLAFAFVHRLPHGNNTSSNITFEGRMVDFGATSAVPSWAVTATSLMPDLFSQRFDAAARAIKSLCYYFGRHVDPRLASPKLIDKVIGENRAVFHRQVFAETLKLCGASNTAAQEAIAGKRLEKVQQATLRAINHYQKSYVDFVDADAFAKDKDEVWDFSEVWRASPPPHLRALAKIVRDIVPSREREEAIRHCEFHSRLRRSLYSPTMRSDFFERLTADGRSCLVLEPEALSAWVESRVASSLVPSPEM